MSRGITVYTLFVVVVIALSLFFLFLLLLRFSKVPENKGKEFCMAKQKAYCLEWYSKGFKDERPKGYDFSECKKKYGIEEPTLQTCKKIMGMQARS